MPHHRYTELTVHFGNSNWFLLTIPSISELGTVRLVITKHIMTAIQRDFTFSDILYMIFEGKLIIKPEEYRTRIVDYCFPDSKATVYLVLKNRAENVPPLSATDIMRSSGFIQWREQVIDENVMRGRSSIVQMQTSDGLADVLGDMIENAANTLIGGARGGNVFNDVPVAAPLAVIEANSRTSEYRHIPNPPHTQCTICHDDFAVIDTVRILSCNHYFHKDCIDSWFTTHVSCPICRNDIRG